jgi:hypothetical protein
MEIEDNRKLNKKLLIRIRTWTDQHLDKISKQLGLSKAVLCRAYLNDGIERTLRTGIENLHLTFQMRDIREISKKLSKGKP